MRSRGSSAVSNSSDPFDIEWRTEDPRGKDIKIRKSRIAAREALEKHVGDELLSTDAVKILIEDPARIDLTESSPRHVEVYYSDPEDEPLPYARAAVQFDGDEGEVISWSRYLRHVSYIEIVYEKPGASDGDVQHKA